MAKSRKHFYLNISITNIIKFQQIPECDFGFDSNAIMIANDSAHTLQFSFNGKDLHGEIFNNDKFITMDNIHESKIWFKSSSVAITKFRVTAWT